MRACQEERSPRPAAGPRQLAAVVGLIEDTFRRNLVGAYLHGSAVLGGPLPTSDVDILVVSRRGTTTSQRRRLIRQLIALSVPPGDPRHAHSDLRPIELTVVTEAAIRPWRYPPEMEFQYGDWLREGFAGGRIPRPAPNADLALVVEVVRRGSAALVGPPPAEVFEPVPWNDVVASMTAGIEEELAVLEKHTRNVLLTLARMWLTLATGEIARKDAAAEWVAKRAPSDVRAVLERARHLYLNGQYGPWDELSPRIRPAAGYLVSEIRRLATTPVSR